MKITFILGTALVLALGLSACKKPDEAVGPAQKAGAAIDDAGAKVAAKLHEPIDKAKQVGQQMEDAAKDTSDKIKEATEDASKGIDKATVEVGKKVEQAGEKIQQAGKK
jgi:F0F1-type ATP synthase membrane subunit b/b'